MTTSLIYIIARNSQRRPTLQHAVLAGQGVSYTLCGQYIGEWSRVYSERLEVLLCQNCQKRGA